MSLEGWREGLFQLCWRQHGGSGLGATLDEALELSTADRDWLLERIGQQRERESSRGSESGSTRRSRQRDSAQGGATLCTPPYRQGFTVSGPDQTPWQEAMRGTPPICVWWIARSSMRNVFSSKSAT